MKPSHNMTYALASLGAVAVVGALILVSSGSSTSAAPSASRPGSAGGIKDGTASSPTGLTVSKTCGIVIDNLDRAQSAAFSLGRTHPIRQAKSLLYRAGECGITFPLRPTPDQARSNYLVTFQLLRGQVAGYHMVRDLAQAMLNDAFFQVAVAKIDTDGLPRSLP